CARGLYYYGSGYFDFW
nr:immunoglobulin heavy chain junction region [Mus musculus]MBK4185901.1 immunoglobulin heavy chain junction region [Mus musculus]MBK4185902.1 immunoglobulin heavy chain junction region [Mus musculus]MBK4185904.1 immunoglobulin heavy chain junction region [Mus musculus]MBK4185910.1 immunoglobulin heavy chain junction region [Mus musculus]